MLSRPMSISRSVKPSSGSTTLLMTRLRLFVAREPTASTTSKAIIVLPKSSACQTGNSFKPSEYTIYCRRPEITPVFGSRVTPIGRTPLLMLHVYGAVPPLTPNSARYRIWSVAVGKLVVVIETGLEFDGGGGVGPGSGSHLPSYFLIRIKPFSVLFLSPFHAPSQYLIISASQILVLSFSCPRRLASFLIHAANSVCPFSTSSFSFLTTPPTAACDLLAISCSKQGRFASEEQLCAIFCNTPLFTKRKVTHPNKTTPNITYKVFVFIPLEIGKPFRSLFY